MKRIHYVSILSCFLLFSCYNKKQSVQNMDNVPVQDIKWKSQKDFEIKDLVEDIQYILLENKTECLFSGINKLIIENDRIYILDMYDTKSLLVFDITGKFLHKVGGVGGGPGEYRRFIYFDVYDNMVYIYDISNRKILIYDENGKFVNSVQSSFAFSDFYILEQKKYLLSLDPDDNDNKVAVTDDLQKSDTTYFSFSKDFKDVKGNPRSFQPFHSNKIAYMFPVSDTLFVFNEQGNVESGYFFDFGDRKLPEYLKNDYEEAIEQERDNNYIYIIDTPIRIKQYIIARLSMGNQRYIAAFDIQKNESTYELVSIEDFNIKNISFPLYAMDDSTLVSYIDNYIYEIMKDKDLLDSAATEHLSNDGVVLCLYKIK